MESERITIQAIAGSSEVVVNYSDDDIVIIDTVNKLVEPTVARLNMNVFVVSFHGRATCEVNGQQLEIHENQVVIFPPNVTLDKFMMSPDFEFKGMFLTNPILQSFLREKIGLWNEMMYVHKSHVLTIDATEMEFIKYLYQTLQLSIESDDKNPYKSDVIQSLLRAAILGLCGKFSHMLTEEKPSPRPRHDTLFQRFLDLLGNNAVKHRTVEYYASQLYVSPKYLSAVCKKKSGKTANEWIREHVLEDIRYYLRETDYSIKQICDMTGFPNTSFFGKYVKEHFGITPSKMRS